MRALSTALLAGFLVAAGASSGSAQIVIEDLGTIPVPGTRVFGNPDTINGMFNNDYPFTIDMPAPSGAANVIEIELLPTFEIDSFTVSLLDASRNLIVSANSILSDFPGQEVHSAFLQFPALQTGSYILNVAGSAIGSLGGSYAGNIALAPLPGAALVLLSALGGLVAVRRYRQSATEA